MSQTQTGYARAPLPVQDRPGTIDLNEITISDRGIVCESLAKAETIARYRAKAGMLPMVGRASERKPMPIEQAAMIIAYGARFGFDDSWSLKYITTINNQPVVWGAGISSILWASGLMLSFRVDYPDDDTCVVRGMRRGVADELEFTFRTSDFSSTTRNNPTFREYKKDHLTHKCIARFARTFFADATSGMELAEDLLETITVAPREPIRPTRRTEQVAGDMATSHAGTEAAPPPIDTPPAVGPTHGGTNAMPSEAAGELISPAQLTRLHAIGSASGLDQLDIKAWLARKYGFASSRAVTRGVYDEICRKIESGNLGDEPTEHGGNG